MFGIGTTSCGATGPGSRRRGGDSSESAAAGPPTLTPALSRRLSFDRRPTAGGPGLPCRRSAAACVAGQFRESGLARWMSVFGHGVTAVGRASGSGGAMASETSRGTRIEWGGGVEASMLADPHPDVFRPSPYTPGAGNPMAQAVGTGRGAQARPDAVCSCGRQPLRLAQRASCGRRVGPTEVRMSTAHTAHETLPPELEAIVQARPAPGGCWPGSIRRGAAQQRVAAAASAAGRQAQARGRQRGRAGCRSRGAG
jgi:hypothetical protein